MNRGAKVDKTAKPYVICTADGSETTISLQRSLPSTVIKYDELTMATHFLKCLPEFFERSKAGVKNYEIRINDRNFKVGDIVILQLYDPERGGLLGPCITREIDYILKGGQYGIAKDYVILELRLLS
jgi:hypothetical protein